MDAKRFVAGWIATLFLLGSAHAQGQFVAPPAPPVVTTTEPMVVSTPPVTNGGYDVPGISNWIRRDPACCNGPVGKNSEIGSELYFRVGPSIPLGDGPELGRRLAVGFDAKAGARTLFYNHEFTRAWAVDASISNTFNSGTRDSDPVVLLPVAEQLKVTEVNRTYVNLGFGREWFWQPAKDNPAGLRLGVDGGGRWGSMKVSFDKTGHRTDVIGGLYTGTHLMYEFACYQSIVNVGVRAEYSYTWSDVLHVASDISEMNVLFNVGVRY